MNKYNYIIAAGNCIHQNTLLAYLDKKLSNEETWEVENHISNCDFCSDALDGLMLQPSSKTITHLDDIKKEFEQKLQQQLQNRTLDKKNSPHLTATVNQSNIDTFPSDVKTTPAEKSNRKNYWAIAASILFILGIGGYSVFSYIKNQQLKNELAKGTSSEVKNGDYAYKDNNNELTTITVNPEDIHKQTPVIIPDSKNEKNSETQKTLSKDETVLSKNIILKKDKIDGSIAPSTKKNVDVAVNHKNEYAQAMPSSSNAIEAKPTVDNSTAYENTTSRLKEEVPTPPSKTEPLKVNVTSNNGYGLKKASEKNNVANTYNSNQQSYTSPQSNQIQTKKTESDDQEIESINYNMHDSRAMYEHGLNLYNQGHFKQSIRFFKNALKVEPVFNRTDIMQSLALAYKKINKESEANELLEQIAIIEKAKEAKSKKTKK